MSSKKLWLGSGVTARGFTAEQLTDAFARYLPHVPDEMAGEDGRTEGRTSDAVSDGSKQAPPSDQEGASEQAPSVLPSPNGWKAEAGLPPVPFAAAIRLLADEFDAEIIPDA